MALVKMSREALKQQKAKYEKLQAKANTVKKGDSLIVRVQNICEKVQQKLGHYADVLEVITTKEHLHDYISAAIEKDIIAIDTETTGLDPITVQIVGACIYTRGQKPAYIPINHVDYITNVRLENQLTEKDVAEEFQRLVVANTKAIFFNAKFDIRVMRWTLGVNIQPAHCGFIAAKCLKDNEEQHNLKYLWKKYCCPPDFDEPALTFDAMFKGLNFSLIPIHTAYLYAAKDALMTLELYDFQMQYLDENNPKCQAANLEKVAKLYRDIELPIISIVADIEDQGVVIDLDYVKELETEFKVPLKEAEEEVHKELAKYKDDIELYKSSHPEASIETPLNLNSSKQLAELFYGVLKQPVINKKKPNSTDAETLEAMGHPICKPLLGYKKLVKLVNTYIDALPDLINPKTNRLHCSFNQYGAACVIGDTIIKTREGEKTIQRVFEENIPNMEYGKFYKLELPLYNRNHEIEISSEAIKYEEQPIIKLTFDDNTVIAGTYNHPILCNDEFLQLQDLEVGDKVDSYIAGINVLTIISKEFDTADVYDFVMPETHSFVTNAVISHNTGRFSSSNPNFQNIPSRGKGSVIRRMFSSSDYADVEIVDGTLDFLIEDIIPTTAGEKLSQDLQRGDYIICEDGNHCIKDIKIEEEFITVYLEEKEDI